MNYARRAYMTVFLGGLMATTGAMAQTATASFNVTMTITASCLVNSATDLNFGSSGVIAANVDATSAVTVQCTSGTPYTLGLSAGQGVGATVTNRLMTGPTNTIGYSLYTDANRTTIWGNTPGTNTQSGSGTGAAQSYTVYGRVPPQSTPPAGVYTDVVTATITY